MQHHHLHACHTPSPHSQPWDWRDSREREKQNKTLDFFSFSSRANPRFMSLYFIFLLTLIFMTFQLIHRWSIFKYVLFFICCWMFGGCWRSSQTCYQCWVLCQTHSLISDLQADFKGEMIYCCLFNVGVSVCRNAMKRTQTSCSSLAFGLLRCKQHWSLWQV